MDPIAFFLDNSALEDVDFSFPLKGNPGTGATEFMTVLVAHELSKMSVDVTLLTTSMGAFPAGLSITKVNDINDAILYAAKNQAILTIRAHISGLESILEEIKVHKELKVVIWAHLTPRQQSLKSIAKTSQVKAVVCLENNQRVRMGDSLIHSKLLTIPYGITGCTEFVRVSENANTIVYTGALVPQKGFHLLADAWPQIKKAIPDAKLCVFGSGRLYDSRIELGSRGIATPEYENRIFRNLDGIAHNIEFYGNSDSKTRKLILDKCKLGIVNPSAQTETFCLSAVEFQQRGVPVVGGRKFGLLDTVKHKGTGFLVFKQSNLSKHIIRLMKDDSRLERYGINAQEFVLEKYKLSKTIDRWHNVFDAVSQNSRIQIDIETRRMRIRSLQALFVIINRQFIFLSRGLWPSSVTIWENTKRFGKTLSYFRRRQTR